MEKRIQLDLSDKVQNMAVYQVERGGKTIIQIEFEKSIDLLTASGSGKSAALASSKGNQRVGALSIGFNCFIGEEVCMEINHQAEAKLKGQRETGADIELIQATMQSMIPEEVLDAMRCNRANPKPDTGTKSAKSVTF